MNLLRIEPATGEVEIRIDRLKGVNDQNLALEGFDDFATRLAGVLNLEEHLIPVDVRPAFPAMVAAEDETFMLTDHAADASARQVISSRRERSSRAVDIRRHPNHLMKGDQYVRDSLHIYWNIDRDEDNRLFTIISAVRPKEDQPDLEYAKVYVSAKVEPGELAYVLARVRRFAA